MKFEKIQSKDITKNPILNGVLAFNGYDKSILSRLEPKKIDLKFDDVKVESFVKYVDKWRQSQRIVVNCCDYDGDGDTSGAAMTKFLQREGVNVVTKCLSRKHGFGLFKETIDEIIADYGKEAIGGIVTVDNGSKSNEVIKYAKSLIKDLDVIVTDHHDKNEGIEDIVELFINPHYDNSITNENICGMMVVLVLVKQYYVKKSTLSQNKTFMAELIELAGVASVTDVMPVFDENRTAIKFFIDHVNNEKVINLGLRTLIEEANINPKSFTADDIGFKVGPMLNACGRLTTSETPTGLLLSTTKDEAVNLSRECIETNKERQDMTKALKDALVIEDRPVKVMTYDNAHEGLIGIIAGNLEEETGSPSFVFTKCEKGYKGSGRSPINYNLIKGATEVFKAHPEIVVAFGGHPGAMGLTLKDLDSVKKFNKYMDENYLKSGCEALSVKYINYPNMPIEDVYKGLEEFEPFGEGFAKPNYKVVGIASNVKIISEKHMGWILKVKNYADETKPIIIKMNWFKHVEDTVNLEGLIEVYFTVSKSSVGNNIFYSGNVIYAQKYQKK